MQHHPTTIDHHIITPKQSEKDKSLYNVCRRIKEGSTSPQLGGHTRGSMSHCEDQTNGKKCQDTLHIRYATENEI